ncbi:hypothetical protein [Streptomyces sp. KL116D]|uniref:hypothetical protein n=1 Tax=Streptomyces sp. KL116D TaxID=3045152 RepID=UPI003558FED7
MHCAGQLWAPGAARAADWSAPAVFETGLTEAKDWSADWITHKDWQLGKRTVEPVTVTLRGPPHAAYAST